MKQCSYCGEEVPVRLIDNDGYTANELVCEDCFYHSVMSWDDLPEPEFQKDAGSCKN
jgi:TPP-dependent 2-oxoacid decarboxylase